MEMSHSIWARNKPQGQKWNEKAKALFREQLQLKLKPNFVIAK